MPEGSGRVRTRISTVLIQAVMRLCVRARTCVCVRAACACVCAELHRDRWTRRKEQYYGQNLHVLRGLPLRFHVCHRPARVAFSLPGVLRHWLAAASDDARLRSTSCAAGSYHVVGDGEDTNVCTPTVPASPVFTINRYVSPMHDEDADWLPT